MILTYGDELEASTRDFRCNESNLLPDATFGVNSRRSPFRPCHAYLAEILNMHHLIRLPQ
jgi:hypothetical protein